MIVWDNHTCLPFDPADGSVEAHLAAVQAGGTTVVAVNVGFDARSIEDNIRTLAAYRAYFLARPQRYMLVADTADIASAHARGRLGIFFDIEGAGAIGDRLSMISLYYDLGVRWMSVAYNKNNRVGGGCLDDDSGLTAFGAAAVDEMARVGMITCCSHTGERTVLDTIEHARNPVIFSHSNPRALWDHPRNITDTVIRKCAAKGGVIGINGVGMFLGKNDTSSATIARNIDYIVQLAGIDHVALGLDYVHDTAELLEYVAARPEVFGADAERVKQYGVSFASPQQLPQIVERLRSLGYAGSDVTRIMGRNLLRVAQAVWRSPDPPGSLVAAGNITARSSSAEGAMSGGGD